MHSSVYKHQILFPILSSFLKVKFRANKKVPTINVPVSIVVWGVSIDTTHPVTLDSLGVKVPANDINHIEGATSNIQDQLDNLSEYVHSLITSGTEDLEDGVSPLAAGTYYFVY